MSRRMGQDKARLVVLEFPLVMQICRVGLSVSNRVYVVAGSDRDYSDIMPSGCEQMIDRVLEGPLVALSDAMSNLFPHNQNNPKFLKDDWVLALACDLPNLSMVAVEAWVKRLPTLPDKTIAYLPKSDEGWEPLCGFYHVSAGPLLEQFVALGGRSFQRWLAQESVAPLVQELEWSDRHLFLNCNTMSDLEGTVTNKLSPTDNLTNNL